MKLTPMELASFYESESLPFGMAYKRIKNLAARGYIAGTPDPSDGRGTLLYDRTDALVGAVISTLLGRLSKRELLEISKFLYKNPEMLDMQWGRIRVTLDLLSGNEAGDLRVRDFRDHAPIASNAEFIFPLWIALQPFWKKLPKEKLEKGSRPS